MPISNAAHRGQGALRIGLDAIVLAVILSLTFLFGGSARADSAGTLVTAPLGAVALGFALISAGVAWRAQLSRGVVIFALCAFALPLIQLIPLPPFIWQSMAGRGDYAGWPALAGMDAGWRPISLVPARTLNAAYGLMLPLGALLIAMRLDERSRRMMLWTLFGIGLISSFLGAIQLVGTASADLYFHRITNPGFAVGLFANRNHHAAFLAVLPPLAAALLRMTRIDPLKQARATILFVSFTAVLAPVIVLTGSRAGLGLYVAALLACWLILRGHRQATLPSRRRGGGQLLNASQIRIVMIAGVLTVAAIMLLLFFARAASIERLFNADLSSLRTASLPYSFGLLRDTLPWGTGIQTFADVYQTIEPLDMVGRSYLNQAHNDPLQLAIEGGLPGIALMAAFALAFMARVWSAWRDRALGSGGALPIACAAAMLILILAGIVDYPLRTPALASLFAVLAGWLFVAPAQLLGAGRD